MEKHRTERGHFREIPMVLLIRGCIVKDQKIFLLFKVGSGVSIMVWNETYHRI